MVKVKMVALLALSVCLLVVLTSCTGKYNPSKSLYQLGVMSIKKVPHPKGKFKPIDRAAESLMNDGVDRIRYGLTICLAAFAVSIFFANPITARISNYVLIGGGLVSIDGFMLVFMAEYLPWFCGLFVLLFCLLLWARKKSIVTLVKKAKKPKGRALDFMER